MSEEIQLTIDLNTADAETLTQIAGIGPALAERIIAARPFKSLEDLRRVSGIGPSFLEQLRPHVSLPSAQTVVGETGLLEDFAPGEELAASEEERRGLAPTAVEEKSTPTEVTVLPESLLPSEERATAPEEEAAADVQEPVSPEEVRPSEAKPAPIPADQQAVVTRTQALLMAFGSGILALFLALGLTLGVLAGINGGRLRYASPAQVDALSTRVGGLQSRTDTLERDLSGLRGRVDQLEALGGRVSMVEQGIEDVQAEVASAASEVENLSGQVDEITNQLETLQTESARFSSFLDGLRELMEGLFATEEGGK